mmetsp:Transcript_86822/g.202060  ORF Transcript_86822/g.202060 Transcript_86822/m.202060 type:complete len:238 (-) Transcript_86822:329-1042(-)
MGCAGVQDSCAVPGVANVQPTIVHKDTQNLDHPIPQLRFCQGHPREGFKQVSRVVPTKRDLALLFVVSLRQEHAEVKGSKAAVALLPGQVPEETELTRDRQALQAKAENGVKGEVLEGVAGHVVGHHQTGIHAVLVIHLLALFLIRRCSQANFVPGELTPHLPLAVANADLISLVSGKDRHTVDVGVLTRDGLFQIVRLLLHTSRVDALARGDDDVTGTRVKDDSEFLWRIANMHEA